MKTVWAKFRDKNATRLGVFLLGALLLVAGAGLVAGAVRSGVAYAAAAEDMPGSIQVGGAVPTPLTLTVADLEKMPRATATLTADGTTVTYSGVLLYDVLKAAGWKFGREMTGKPMASYLIATAKDGYQVVFALPEIDPQFSGAKVILADEADGAPLPAAEGPFRLVAPEDKMHARSIYSLVKLDVVRLRQ